VAGGLLLTHWGLVEQRNRIGLGAALYLVLAQLWGKRYGREWAVCPFMVPGGIPGL
jgi:hypothetical protein